MSIPEQLATILLHMKSDATVNSEDSTVSRWPHSARSVGLARAELSDLLIKWGLSTVSDEAQLVLSELVTNEVRHGRTTVERDIETRCSRVPDGVRIEVRDWANERPVIRVPSDTGGWGLGLVDELSASWGVDERAGAGKSVWAVVTAPEES
ncbi:ATP-binding protein [Streptomyces sp. NPDC007100]|uniref:ATP-binding protein n=1 Tax=Streptomyces sp. NPDC007100 TaxID=3155602 RepID=UPI0033CB0ADE